MAGWREAVLPLAQDAGDGNGTDDDEVTVTYEFAKKNLMSAENTISAIDLQLSRFSMRGRHAHLIEDEKLKEDIAALAVRVDLDHGRLEFEMSRLEESSRTTWPASRCSAVEDMSCSIKNAWTALLARIMESMGEQIE